MAVLMLGGTHWVNGVCIRYGSDALPVYDAKGQGTGECKVLPFIHAWHGDFYSLEPVNLHLPENEAWTILKDHLLTVTQSCHPSDGCPCLSPYEAGFLVELVRSESNAVAQHWLMDVVG